MVLSFITVQKKKNVELLIEMIFYYATQVDNINMGQLMSQEQYVFPNRKIVSKIFSQKY